MYKMLYNLVIPFLLLGSISCSRWIDPHDMNTNAKEKYMKSTLKTSSDASLAVNENGVSPESNICPSHLKRTISVLLNSAYIDKRDPGNYKGQIYFMINPDDLEFLTVFAKSDLTLENLRRLDTIISESFKKSFIDEYLLTLESFQFKLYSIVLNIYNLWLLGVICLLYIVFQLFKNDFSFAYILKYLILVIWICDYGFRYNYLLEEAEEHNLNIVYSQKCDTVRMSWSDWTKFWLTVRDCEKKTVTPLDTFLYQIKSIIIIPLQAVGTGMGGFGYNIFKEMPFPLNWIFLPLLLVAGIVLLVSIIVIITGEQIEFNMFHLIKLKFGGKSSECKQKSLHGTTLETILDKVMHRPMVQNISVSVPSTNSSNTQETNGVQPKTLSETPVVQCKITSPKKEGTTQTTSGNKTDLELPGETCCCKTFGTDEEEKLKKAYNDDDVTQSK